MSLHDPFLYAHPAFIHALMWVLLWSSSLLLLNHNCSCDEIAALAAAVFHAGSDSRSVSTSPPDLRLRYPLKCCHKFLRTPACKCISACYCYSCQYITKGLFGDIFMWILSSPLFWELTKQSFLELALSWSISSCIWNNLTQRNCSDKFSNLAVNQECFRIESHMNT